MSIIRIWMGLKNTSLTITICHNLASCMMPVGDHWDVFFYPTHKLIRDFIFFHVANGKSVSSLFFYFVCIIKLTITNINEDEISGFYPKPLHVIDSFIPWKVSGWIMSDQYGDEVIEAPPSPSTNPVTT